MKKFIYIFLIICISMIILLNTQCYATSDIIVMLDPGHGGSTGIDAESGAVSGGMIEKNLNWKIALKVKEIFDRTPGITGILTRNGDEGVSIKNRGEKARDNNADLLVSFHINSSPYVGASGAEVYITANTNQKRFHEYSKVLGNAILNNLKSVGVRSNRYSPIIKFSTDGEAYSDGFLSDWYGIIRNPMYYGIPGMIIEHAYINNPYDRQHYLNDNMLNKMAEADAKAIIANKELFRIDKSANSMGNANLKLQIATNSKGQPYLYGEVLVNDWVNNMRMNPGRVPNIRLKSTDGTVSYNCWSIVSRDNIYYFDTLLNPIDKTKEYYIEIESNEKNLIPVNYKQNMELTNKTLGTIGKDKIVVKNNKISFEYSEYVGDLANEIKELSVAQENGKNYIRGKAIVTEWINGTKWSEPKGIPIFRLKSTDNKVIVSGNVKQLQGNSYEFMLPIDSIDISKIYEIEIESASKYNVSKYRKVISNYSKNGKIGSINKKDIKINNNKITILESNYYGDLGTQINILELAKNEKGKTYIKGEINITEWIGTTWNIPSGLPTVTIKSTDGEDKFECWVRRVGSNNYYFDTYIEGIDINKKYNIEVSLTNPHNISKYKTGNAYYGKNKFLGKYYNENVEFVKEQILFGKQTYIGDVATQIDNIKLSSNMIEGTMYITEWLNGVTWSVPTHTPIIRLKATDGIEVKQCVVNKVSGNKYKYSVDIKSLDMEKQYILEVESANSLNKSNYKKVSAYWGKNITLGIYENMKVVYQNEKIQFKSNKYRGDIASQINDISVKNNTLIGSIYITEWIDGKTWSVPSTIPNMSLKMIDGEWVKKAKITKKSSNLYEFSIDINEIDVDKKYNLEVASSNSNNISEYKVANVSSNYDRVIGAYKNSKMRIYRTEIFFK